MAYEAVNIVTGSVIEASWGNKIESHLERLGAYRGVVASAANLPDVSTLDEGDWYILKTEHQIRMCISGAYVTLKFPPASHANESHSTQMATSTELSTHSSNTSNPHSVTKEQVGLGSVLNYGIATQAEAEAGTVSDKYMTPERTKQAIDAIQADYSTFDVDELFKDEIDSATPPEILLGLFPSTFAFNKVFSDSSRRQAIYAHHYLISSALLHDGSRAFYKDSSSALGEILNNESRAKYWINNPLMFWRSDNAASGEFLEKWLAIMTKSGGISLSNTSAVGQPFRYGFYVERNNSTSTTYSYFRITGWNLSNINTFSCRVRTTRSTSNTVNSTKITLNGTTIWSVGNVDAYDATDGEVLSFDFSGQSGVQYLSFESRGYRDLLVTEMEIT